MAGEAQPPVAQGWRGWIAAGLLLVVVALALPFVIHAARFGWRGLTGAPGAETHLYDAEFKLANAAIFAHMLSGAVLTFLAPFQLIAVLRSRVPRLHRFSGYVIAVAALLTGLGGLVYIAARGTIGGPLMDLGFAGYGLCVLGAAAMTLRHARARAFEVHRAWALRLFVLAIGSWLYRLHYALWYLLTGGVASRPDFSGAFDQIQNFAFYVPYLLLVELLIRHRRARRAA